MFGRGSWVFLALPPAVSTAGHVVPGRVQPSWPQTWDMARSTGMMVCNSSGPVDPVFASPWGMVDLDWNGGKVDWSRTSPMSAEEFMLENILAIRKLNPLLIGWVYRNGVKALPWHTTVRRLLEDRAQWGLFVPLEGCMHSSGHYVCGPNAADNLYHDFEQTPHGACGQGVQCGEYVFDHRNVSLRSFLLGEYFFGSTSAANPAVDGFYVDDGWNSNGPTEMDKDSVAKMGLSVSDVADMITAWKANQQAWRDKLVANGKFEWGLFYGGQQTAPGQNQTCGQCTCQSYLRRNCGAHSPSQNGTLFYGYSRVTHQQPFPLPTPESDLAMFLLSRGPYAIFGYGWTGCADIKHPFTRPASLDRDYGTPLNYCTETSPGSMVWYRNFSKADISIDCNTFKATFQMKP